MEREEVRVCQRTLSVTSTIVKVKCIGSNAEDRGFKINTV
jgi:hypothetical protein